MPSMEQRFNSFPPLTLVKYVGYVTFSAINAFIVDLFIRLAIWWESSKTELRSEKM